MQKMKGGSNHVAFTRILHRTKVDALMAEVRHRQTMQSQSIRHGHVRFRFQPRCVQAQLAVSRHHCQRVEYHVEAGQS